MFSHEPAAARGQAARRLESTLNRELCSSAYTHLLPTMVLSTVQTPLPQRATSSGAAAQSPLTPDRLVFLTEKKQIRSQGLLFSFSFLTENRKEVDSVSRLVGRWPPSILALTVGSARSLGHSANLQCVDFSPQARQALLCRRSSRRAGAGGLGVTSSIRRLRPLGDGLTPFLTQTRVANSN